MKKIICLVLSLISILTLCSCQQTNRTTDEGNSSVTPSESSENQVLNGNPTMLGLDFKDRTLDLQNYGVYDWSTFVYSEYAGMGYDPREMFWKSEKDLMFPDKECFTVGTAGGVGRSYRYAYDYSVYYSALGSANTFKLLNDADYEIYEHGGSSWAERFKNIGSKIEVWDRTGALRSLTLSMEEFPEAKINGEITEKALIDKAQALLRLYDSGISLPEFADTPEIKTVVRYTRVEDGQKERDGQIQVDGIFTNVEDVKALNLEFLENCENISISGYEMRCSCGDDLGIDWRYRTYFAIRYDLFAGEVYVYADSDVPMIYKNDLVTEEVLTETVNRFFREHLKEEYSNVEWDIPVLRRIGHKNGYTILEVSTGFAEPKREEDIFYVRNVLYMIYEIPDGTDLLREV